MREERCWHPIGGQVDTRLEWADERDLAMRRETETYWAVHSDDGVNYRVGTWAHGAWHPGPESQANREAQLLRDQGEPGAHTVLLHYHPDTTGPHLRAGANSIEKALS